MSEQEVITTGVFEGLITWDDGELEVSRPQPSFQAANDWLTQRLAEDGRQAAAFTVRPSSQLTML